MIQGPGGRVVIASLMRHCRVTDAVIDRRKRIGRRQCINCKSLTEMNLDTASSALLILLLRTKTRIVVVSDVVSDFLTFLAVDDDRSVACVRRCLPTTDV